MKQLRVLQVPQGEYHSCKMEKENKEEVAQVGEMDSSDAVRSIIEY